MRLIDVDRYVFSMIRTLNGPTSDDRRVLQIQSPKVKKILKFYTGFFKPDIEASFTSIRLSALLYLSLADFRLVKGKNLIINVDD